MFSLVREKISSNCFLVWLSWLLRRVLSSTSDQTDDLDLSLIRLMNSSTFGLGLMAKKMGFYCYPQLLPVKCRQLLPGEQSIKKVRLTWSTWLFHSIAWKKKQAKCKRNK